MPKVKGIAVAPLKKERRQTPQSILCAHNGGLGVLTLTAIKIVQSTLCSRAVRGV